MPPAVMTNAAKANAHPRRHTGAVTIDRWEVGS